VCGCGCGSVVYECMSAYESLFDCAALFLQSAPNWHTTPARAYGAAGVFVWVG